MATYKQIFGKQVKFLSADPPAALGEGQVWYNSTSGTFKSSVNIGGAFASGGALNVGLNAIRGAGSQTAGLAVGGDGAPGPLGTTQIYDGDTWTTSPDTIVPTRNSGAMSTAGTTTAAWYAGGNNPGGGQNVTENFDGSTWSASGVYPASIGGMGGAGTLTAGLAFGGSPSHPTATNEYDGSTWTAVPGVLNVGRNFATGCGLQTAALSAGGEIPAVSNTSETYDGSTWTTTNNLSTANANAALFGTTATAQLCGGTPGSGVTAAVQSWDGTSWAANPASLATAVQTNGAAGTSGVSGMSFGGSPFVTATEEYTDPTISVQTITTS